MKLITKQHQVYDNIDRLYDELSKSPQLSERLGLVHAWYIDARDPDRPKFGFSKFVGYRKLDGNSYLSMSKKLNGRSTEWALKDFCEELRPGSPQYVEYREKLAEWLSEFGKSPRNPVRLMMLHQQSVDEDDGEDRRLFDLVAAVTDLLPLSQRHELRLLL